jgi:tRNA-dihydrouridine synthase C
MDDNLFTISYNRRLSPPQENIMRLILGPMEGVLDHLMRDMLTSINDYDMCVTEFVRVIDQRLPNSVFYRLCPELHQGGFTPSGTPVRVQLLGQEPNIVAENAERAIQLGSQGVDINFGCPAKAVNKSRGGAVLLQEPDLLYRIVKESKAAVGDQILSAKVRLGWENVTEAEAIIDALTEAGADEITVHARTKMDGYKASAIRWDRIADLKQRTSVPIVANGEIWNYEDGQRCLQESQADALMVCRGAFNLPNLGQMVKYNHIALTWQEIMPLLLQYSTYEIAGDKGLYYPNRIKQWLNYLRQEYPQADKLFMAVRRLKKSNEIVAVLQAENLIIQ